MKKKTIPCCFVQIFTDLDLEELANVISERVLGGVKFIGRDQCIRDEFPAVYTEKLILGTAFILAHVPDEGLYYLECDSRGFTESMTVDEIRRSYVDISGLVCHLLEKENGITTKVLKPE